MDLLGHKFWAGDIFLSLVNMSIARQIPPYGPQRNANKSKCPFRNE
jgi:hypothetical protein